VVLVVLRQRPVLRLEELLLLLAERLLLVRAAPALRPLLFLLRLLLVLFLPLLRLLHQPPALLLPHLLAQTLITRAIRHQIQ
jgi:hypothetical protein